MNQEQRNALRVAVQGWRRTLEADIEGQLSAIYGIARPEGAAAKAKGKKAAEGDPNAGLIVRNLVDVPRVQASRRLQARREIILAAIHDLATRRETSAGKTRPAGEAGQHWPPCRVLDMEGYVRACAFTLLNRLVGIRLLEQRGHYQQAFLNGQEEPPALQIFVAVARNVLGEDDPYELLTRLLLQDVTRFAPGLGDASGRFDLLFPGRETVLTLSRSMAALDPFTWQSDETLGWVAQYFTPEELRKRVRKESPTPRSSDELAFRNQFFTPNYVVRFLVQNTLGRSWLEMHPETALAAGWEYLVRDELQPRAPKDPRDLKIIDPACGSGHFLLYTFEVLHDIYHEFYDHETLGAGLRAEYPQLQDFARRVPELIVERNLYGVDIDLRVAQITQVALELKAASYHPDARPSTDHIVHAQQLPGDQQRFSQFVTDELADIDAEERRYLGQALMLVYHQFLNADELGLLLRTAEDVKEVGLRFPLYAQQNLLERVLSVLDRYVQRVSSAGEAAGVMFGNDARQALKLLELQSLHFDVVLMNPPFGAAARDSKAAFEKAYPRTKNDLYAAFVERGLELCGERGRVGCLSSRTGFFLKSYTRWREEVLLGDGHLEIVADLGYGVLDKAMVEVAAYVVERQRPLDAVRVKK